MDDFRMLHWLGLIAVCWVATAYGAAKPIDVPVSQYWDGRDGPWSSFRIEIGTPPQQVRVLPASGSSSSWLVLPEACAPGVSEDPKCKESRGNTYMRNESSTWEESGFYALNTFAEKRVGLGLGEGAGGLYGFDSLSLGWPEDKLPSFEHLMVAGIVMDDFYLGTLPLNPQPITLGENLNAPQSSLMQMLRNESNPVIPSMSWSYTAGLYNTAPKVFGSLVLGGYDATRFIPNDIVFPFGAENYSLGFQVAIQSITTDITGSPLLGQGIISYINTLVPDIWLPTRVCKLFEETFGLVFDNATELYLLDEGLHQILLEKNPTIRFGLGPEVAGKSLTIDMPYHSWYQTAVPTRFSNASGRYLPLRRAANDSQYVLGRAFLQSVYLSADYDRKTFNLSQAVYPSSTTAANILPIIAPVNDTTPSGSDKDTDPKPIKGSNIGAIAGGVVGGVIALVLACAIVIFYRRKNAKNTKKDSEFQELQGNLRHEIDHGAPSPSYSTAKHMEMGEGLRHEVTGDMQQRTELAGDSNPTEVDGASRVIYEMSADSVPNAAEMEATGSSSFPTLWR